MNMIEADRIRTLKYKVRASADELSARLKRDVGDGVELAWLAQECSRLTIQLRNAIRGAIARGQYDATKT